MDALLHLGLTPNTYPLSPIPSNTSSNTISCLDNPLPNTRHPTPDTYPLSPIPYPPNTYTYQ